MSEQQELIQQLFNHAAVALAEGKSKNSIISGFVDDGIPREAAENIVAQANDYKLPTSFSPLKTAYKVISCPIFSTLVGPVISREKVALSGFTTSI